MLASFPNRRQPSNFLQPQYPHSISIPISQQPSWSPVSSSAPVISTPQPLHKNTAAATTNTIFHFGQDQPLFDYQSHQYNASPSMQPEHLQNWPVENGQLTPKSATQGHHRASSLSSLGSAGPASPYTANTSNPQVVGEHNYDFHGYDYQNTSKPLTPAHTPSQEHFLLPHYSNVYQNSNLAFSMSNDGIPRASAGDAELMPAPDFHHSARPSIASAGNRDSPSTPPLYEDERNGNVSRQPPKLDRTMTDAYNDELYNPNIQLTSTPASRPPVNNISPQNDLFQQRLQAANNHHLSAQAPLAIPRERSPFRQGSPLAPTGNHFGTGSPNLRFGTASHLREQQKAENDARALQQQIKHQSPEQLTPKTISPKDVDLVYHESEEDSKAPLFPTQQASEYRQTATMVREPTESDDNVSQRSFGSMATTRRESSSTYSTSSQATAQQGNYSFAAPAVPGSMRQIPQAYPFVAQARREPSNLSNGSEDFPSTLQSMESSSSEYMPADSTSIARPVSTAADTGTYSCTYHNCTLRFETPAKLQRHKREGHRNSAAAAAAGIGGGDESGMTSAAQRNTQTGPHTCNRINPSTGKPCATVFSRPYDLTRHEDTIHNARKQKVHCPLCTEEKTFSRNDALTRHLRVVHPEHELAKSRGRRGAPHD